MEGPSPEELAADCPYINEYCRQRHRGVVKCCWQKEKGRILVSSKAFNQGEVIFREPPLHIVAEQKGNRAFDRLKELCAENPKAFEYDPLWYWTALCSLKPSQLAADEARLKPIEEDQQRKLLLLYHSDVSEPSQAARVLVRELQLKLLEAVDLERLLQIWILNCFEHSDDPLGYSTYFMSSFMSHSCFPNAVWHYERDEQSGQDDFVLRARCQIADGDEISVSYLSEDSLLESVVARRKHLKDSKHFICTCVRCTAKCDLSRGFRCPSCPDGRIFACPSLDESQAADGSGDLLGAACEACGRAPSDAEAGDCLAFTKARALVAEELRLQSEIEGCEKRLERNGRNKHGAVAVLRPLEEAIARAELVLSQHWLLDKAWQLLADAYDRNDRPKDAEALMQKRIAFQEGAYPGLSGARAWTLEAYADMLLRHSGATVDPHVKVPSEQAARELLAHAPRMYADSLNILRLMFGEQHEYYTAVHRKAVELREELQRHLGEESTAS